MMGMGALLLSYLPSRTSGSTRGDSRITGMHIIHLLCLLTSHLVIFAATVHSCSQNVNIFLSGSGVDTTLATSSEPPFSCTNFIAFLKFARHSYRDNHKQGR